MRGDKLPIISETHQRGFVSIENEEFVHNHVPGMIDLGIQTHSDGRIWLCVNGIAWIRFKPGDTQ